MKNFWIVILLLGCFTAGAVAAQQESADTAEVLAPPPIPPETTPGEQPPISTETTPGEQPPIPPKITSEEPEPIVRITEREGERVEEYSRNGRVYMVKITPAIGLPYYYLDEDGDGQLEIQGSDGKGGVRPVYWKIKEW